MTAAITEAPTGTTMIYVLPDHPRLDKTDLSSLELVLYGASPMSPTRLVEGLERIGPIFSAVITTTTTSC